MTPTERHQEFLYRVQERLGLLCGKDQPTPEQIALAEAEARAAVAEIEREERRP